MTYHGVMVCRHVEGMQRLDGLLLSHPSPVKVFYRTGGTDWTEGKDWELFDQARFEPERLEVHWVQLHGRLGAWVPVVGRDIDGAREVAMTAVAQAYMNSSVCGLRDARLLEVVASGGGLSTRLDVPLVGDCSG